MMKRSLAVMALAATLIQAPAHAATFTEMNGFGGDGGGFGSCRTSTSSGAFATGQVLDASSAPPTDCVGYFNAAVDLDAHTITLTGLQTGNYDTGIFEITGISELVITGLSTVSSDDLFDPDIYFDESQDPPNFAGFVPTPQLSFTGSSIRISFTAFGEDPSQFAYDNQGGTAVFSFTSDAIAAPEPATWGLMIAGLGLTGAALRRRRVAALAA